MTNIEDLEQDVVALKRELESLSVKARDLQRTIEQKRLDKRNEKKAKKIKSRNNVLGVISVTEGRANPVISEFESVFERFPQLHDILYNDYNPDISRMQINNDSDDDDNDDDDDDDDISKEDADVDINNDDVLYRNKKKKRTPTDEFIMENGKESSNNSHKGDDLEEHEWVLQNQMPLEHKMFDTSISNMLDTTILSSPSKRKSSKNRIEKNVSLLKDDILLENTYRLFGITFFPVIDPTDLQLNIDTQEMEVTREMLGIRFDIFNEISNSFETPNYILLKRKLKSTQWEIFKYTIPNYINIPLMFNEITYNGVSPSSYDDIYIFAKEVYLKLWKNSIRRQIVENWKGNESITVLQNDLRSTSVKCSINNKLTMELSIDNENNIRSVNILKGVNDEVIKSQIAILFLGPVIEFEDKINLLL